MNSMPPVRRAGGIFGKTTQFGYANDLTPDRNSNVLRIGNRDNPLTPHAVALTDSMRDAQNALPGDTIETIDSKGNKRFGYFGDRAPESDPRVDFYQPQGFDKNIEDHQQVIDLGGGNAKASGRALAALGEANVQRAMSGQQAQTNVAPEANQTPNPALPPRASTEGTKMAFYNPAPLPAAPNPAQIAPWHFHNQINIAQPDQIAQSRASSGPLAGFYQNHPVYNAFTA